MITCYLRYTIDPSRREAFEHYGRWWITLVEKYGGRHHGYFLPKESANDLAVALFTFPSLAAYEHYREQAATDPECIEAFEYAKQTGCILRYDRQFLEPVFDGA
ncbi:MAG: NIPSNAP family protein [Pseudomonadota bacterium]